MLFRPIPPHPLSGLAHWTNGYPPGQRILERQKKNLSPAEYEQFLNWYYDHFFTNRWEALGDSLGSSSTTLQPTTRYNSMGENPLAGYRTARQFLWSVPRESLGLGHLDKAHEHLMSWRSTPGARTWAGWFSAANSEGTPRDSLGQRRNVSVYYDVLEFFKERSELPNPAYFTDKPGLNAHPENIHQMNPYLYFRVSVGMYASSEKVAYLPLSGWRDFQSQLTPELIARIRAAEETHSATTAENQDAKANAIRAEQNRLREIEISRMDGDTERAIENGWIPLSRKESDFKYHRKYMAEVYDGRINRELLMLQDKRYALDDARTKELDALRADYVQVILSHRWNQLHSELRAAKTEGAVVAAIGGFHYDFLSIHPYRNGNGRMARLVTERLLSQYGLPPPIWKHFGEDVALPKPEFLKLFREALSISSQFHKDLDAVTSGGIPYTAAGTGYLAPIVTEAVGKRFPVNAEDFMAWVAASNRSFPKIEGALVYFEQWRDGEAKQANIRLGTPFFIGTFGRFSPTEKAFKDKLTEHYSDRSVHRAVFEREPATDDRLLALFGSTAGARGTAVSIAHFNATVVRDLQGTTGWLETSWWKGDPAQKVGISRLYRDPSRARSAPEGRSSGNLIQIESLERLTASLDSSVPAALMKKTDPKHLGILFQAAGTDPESVVRVRAEGSAGVTKIAERISFNQVEIREMKGEETVGRKVYELNSDGIWILGKTPK